MNQFPARHPQPAPIVQIADAYVGPESAPRFSVGTLMTHPDQYQAMRESFSARGFDSTTTEFLRIDNTGPGQTGAYRGLNALIHTARGDFVILCHQDVRLLSDDRDTLEQRLAEIETRDPDWALAGNAGGTAPGKLAQRISDPHGADRNSGELPQRVMSLDENFIVLKRSARVGCSVDLEGFHFYGPDLCLNADIAGHSAWVIDFHLLHLSGGTKSADFFAAEEAFRAKWSHALRPRWMQTTCALVRLSASVIDREAGRLAARPYAGLLRRVPVRSRTATTLKA